MRRPAASKAKVKVKKAPKAPRVKTVCKKPATNENPKPNKKEEEANTKAAAQAEAKHKQKRKQRPKPKQKRQSLPGHEPSVTYDECSQTLGLTPCCTRFATVSTEPKEHLLLA